MVRGNPARGRKEVTQGAVAILRRKKGAKLCIRSNEFYSTGSWRNWDLNPLAEHTWNSQDASGTKQISEKKKAIWRHYPKRWTWWAKSSRLVFQEQPLDGTSRQADCISKVAWNLARKYASSSRTWNYVLFSCEGARETEYRMCVMDSGASMHNAEQRRIKLRYNTSRRSKNPICDLPRPGSSANKRVSTSFLFMISICSQQCYYSLKKRQRFYCFISFVYNADIHMSGKHRNSTVGPNWEDNYL